ncbi:MAG: UDP-N-acetylmuramoyl-tripeptide--D-alanyl-D-alanine ligase, partial [Deltaproteobacteria bacterium]|nr:UDP-N-acetylmuramoyl-tripeptide--D-alanyl-D-alanine ligase [Deltaproteobacteria bacterium]
KGVSINTRTLEPGEAFVAIKGPRFDGADFLLDAVEKGATGLIVGSDRTADALFAARKAPDRVFVVAVDDTTKALTAMASAWVEVMSPAILAITGSVGKSTTKDLVAAVCATRYTVHSTPGNLNNLLGLSLTCLKLLPRHEVLVVEMGTSGEGEIAQLCRIAPPRLGVVTMVDAAHIEGFGSLDGVARAKAELVAALPPDGCLVINADDPRVAAMGKGVRARVWSYGQKGETDVRIRKAEIGVDGRTGATFEVGGQTVHARLQLVGAHQAYNAAAAIAVGAALGIDPGTCCNAMARVGPGSHRMHLVGTGAIRVIDDCYNASPRTVRAALSTLKEMVATGRRVAVLGDMLELGSLNDQAHIEVGRWTASMGVDVLIAVGRNASLMVKAAIKAGIKPSAAFEAPDALAAADVALAIVEAGDLVLVKGSRGVGLENVVRRLVKDGSTDVESSGEGN